MGLDACSCECQLGYELKRMTDSEAPELSQAGGEFILAEGIRERGVIPPVRTELESGWTEKHGECSNCESGMRQGELRSARNLEATISRGWRSVQAGMKEWSHCRGRAGIG